MRKRILALAGLLATLACQAEETWNGRSAFLEGTEVIDAGPVDDAPVLPWRLGEAPSVRVGGLGRDEEQQFVEISDAAVLSDGRLLVADERTGLVRMFGPFGDFLGQVGSPGEGPGEFRAPASLNVVRGDSIWIWDRALWRMSLFSPEGTFVRSERYDPTAAGLYPMRGMWPESVRLDGQGSRLIRLIRKSMMKASGGVDQDSIGLAVHRYGAETVELTGILPREEQVEVEAPWGPTTLTPPLAAGPRIALGSQDDLACVGHGSAPELRCMDAEGHRVGLRWESGRSAVRPDDPAIARWRDETVEAYSEKISETDVQSMVDAVPVPRFYPAFTDLLFDAEGYLWIGLGPSPEGGSEREYLVLGKDLHLAGRILLPTMDVMEIGAEHVLGVRWDALGVEELVLFSLRR
jgi:hypothetical protein